MKAVFTDIILRKAVVRRFSVKTLFLKISQKSQQNLRQSHFLNKVAFVRPETSSKTIL